MVKSCRNYTKKLCLFVDGLLESGEIKEIREHIDFCDSCKNYLAVLQKSNRLTNHECETSPLFLTERQITSLVYRKLHVINAKKRRLLWGMPYPRFACAMASFAVLAVVTVILQLNKIPEKLYEKTFALEENSKYYLLKTGEGFSWLNDGCAVRAFQKTNVSVLKADARVVRLGLNEGEVLVAGIPGAYDTIQILCDAYIIQARGTKFSLKLSSDTLFVAVIEGALDITSRYSDLITRIQSVKSAFFFNGIPYDIRNLSSDRSAGLSNMFEDLMNDNLFTNNISECVNSDKNMVVISPLKNHNTREDSDLYETALKFYREGMLHAAINVLNRYQKSKESRLVDSNILLGDCYNRLRQYKEAVTFYRKAAECGEGDDIETAIHCANRISLFKLNNITDAEYRVKEYLERYPEGRYRELEHHYLIRIYYKQKNMEKAVELMDAFIHNYPNSCVTPGYRKILSCQNLSDKK